jgi:hypothetical protein
MSILQRLVNALQTTFSTAPELANEQFKVILRQRKFTAQSLAQSFILALLKKPRAGSSDIAAMAATLGVNVTPEAVDQRYSPVLQKFFRSLFERMTGIFVESDEKLAPLLERFSQVKLIDSTVLSLPASLAEEFPGCGGTGGANSAAMKLQTEMDLRTGGICCIEVEEGKSPDQATNRLKIPPQENSLSIADLGYFSVQRLALIQQSKAFFVSRLLSGMNIFVDGKSLNVIDYLKSQDKPVVDNVVRLGAQHQLECRLIAWRVPEEMAARRRHKLRKHVGKKGRTPSQAALDACDWNILVTNLPIDQLSVNEAIVLYRSRWQIELLFKRWKTYCGIDLIDGQNDMITMTRMWPRLCGAIIQQWLVVYCGWTSNKDVPSFSKIAKSISEIIELLSLSLSTGIDLAPALERFRKKTQHLCRRMKRRGKPSFIEILRDSTKLEYSLT